MYKLIEYLENASESQFKLLQKQIEKHPETKRMLTTPLMNIPQYKWLYYQLYDDLKRVNGIYIERLTLYEMLWHLKDFMKVFFSKAGSAFTGFLSYKEEGSKIIAIKMASFKDDKNRANPILAADLIKFLENEITKRTKITWLAHKDNTATINQYDKLLKDKKFIGSKVPDKRSSFWVYTVTGKNK